MTLAGFRSRWSTPRSCAAASPAQICRAISSARSSGNRPMRRSSDARSSPSTYSIERKCGRRSRRCRTRGRRSGARPAAPCALRCGTARAAPGSRSTSAAGTSARPAGRASGRRRDRPRPCRRARAARRCDSDRRGRAGREAAVVDGAGRREPAARFARAARRRARVLRKLGPATGDPASPSSTVTEMNARPGERCVAASMPGRCGITVSIWGLRERCPALREISPASCGMMTGGAGGAGRGCWPLEFGGVII